MEKATPAPAGTGGMSAMDNMAVPGDARDIGYVEPIIGRVAKADVAGYFGFPLIAKGQTVTQDIAERAHSMGRLFELVAATGDI